jgi:plastocyanin
MSPGRAVAALAAATVTAFLLTACGDDSAEDDATLGTEGDGSSVAADPATGADLTVEAHDIEFGRDAYRVDSGPVTIEYQQEGSLPHSLVIEGADGGAVDGFRLEVGGADSDRDTVDLPAGEYLLYCDLPGHRDAGMEADLHVG